MEYEQIAIIHDPFYDDVMKATQIVRDFIISRERILYGGTAIDYALRLKGEKIYPDDRLDAPDFDFFSPTHI
jgi:hypothetical protein